MEHTNFANTMAFADFSSFGELLTGTSNSYDQDETTTLLMGQQELLPQDYVHDFLLKENSNSVKATLGSQSNGFSFESQADVDFRVTPGSSFSSESSVNSTEHIDNPIDTQPDEFFDFQASTTTATTINNDDDDDEYYSTTPFQQDQSKRNNNFGQSLSTPALSMVSMNSPLSTTRFNDESLKNNLLMFTSTDSLLDITTDLNINKKLSFNEVESSPFDGNNKFFNEKPTFQPIETSSKASPISSISPKSYMNSPESLDSQTFPLSLTSTNESSSTNFTTNSRVYSSIRPDSSREKRLSSCSLSSMKSKSSLDSRLSLQKLGEVLHTSSLEETMNIEKFILNIFGNELKFPLGYKTWIRDTDEKYRSYLLDELYQRVNPTYPQLNKNLLETVIKRATYSMMQGRLRKERRAAMAAMKKSKPKK